MYDYLDTSVFGVCPYMCGRIYVVRCICPGLKRVQLPVHHLGRTDRRMQSRLLIEAAVVASSDAVFGSSGRD